MTTNVHFSKGTISEQYLYEDLVIEAIGIYGHDVFYLPRTLVNEDELLGEDPLSKFSDAYGIEMWMETQEGYEGEKDLVTRFGLDIQNETSFIVSRRRWDDVVSRNDNLIVNTRPDEGDLIYFPAVKRLWIISFVDHDDPFYQVNNLPVYKLYCRSWDYSSERLDTGIDAIDAIQIMSVAIIPATITLLYTSKLLGLEKSKYVLITEIISTSALIVGFIILGPTFGVMGLASVFVLSVTLEATLLFCITKIKKF